MNHTLFTDIRITCFIKFIIRTCFYRKGRDFLEGQVVTGQGGMASK